MKSNKIKVDNAIILSAGLGSRMKPLTDITPKSLINVKGDILIERLIKQLKEVGIIEIIVVTGYMSHKFKYLESKYNVKLLYNPDYETKNTWYSLYIARDYLKNSYILSADYYYFNNPFNLYQENPYFETVPPKTEGAIMGVTSDSNLCIKSAIVPAKENDWLEYGHAFFDINFSNRFKELLSETLIDPKKYMIYWEGIYREHINELKMYEKRIDKSNLVELDTVEELSLFDYDWKKNNEWIKELKL